MRPCRRYEHLRIPMFGIDAPSTPPDLRAYQTLICVHRHTAGTLPRCQTDRHGTAMENVRIWNEARAIPLVHTGTDNTITPRSHGPAQATPQSDHLVLVRLPHGPGYPTGSLLARTCPHPCDRHCPLAGFPTVDVRDPVAPMVQGVTFNSKEDSLVPCLRPVVLITSRMVLIALFVLSANSTWVRVPSI